MREGEANISMRIEELEDKSGIEVAGRGILHLSVLMETMRREGYELSLIHISSSFSSESPIPTSTPRARRSSAS